MAYSFIAVSEKEPDWKSLHAQIFREDSAIEMFPIQSEEPGKYYLGICIPFSKLDQYPETWDELVSIINKLKSTFGFDTLDLYHGFFVNDENMGQVKASLFPE